MERTAISCGEFGDLVTAAQLKAIALARNDAYEEIPPIIEKLVEDTGHPVDVVVGYINSALEDAHLRLIESEFMGTT